MTLIKTRQRIINFTLISLLTLPAILPAMASEPANTNDSTAEQIKEAAERVKAEIDRSANKTEKEVKRLIKKW